MRGQVYNAFESTVSQLVSEAVRKIINLLALSMGPLLSWLLLCLNFRSEPGEVRHLCEAAESMR